MTERGVNLSNSLGYISMNAGNKLGIASLAHLQTQVGGTSRYLVSCDRGGGRQ